MISKILLGNFLALGLIAHRRFIYILVRIISIWLHKRIMLLKGVLHGRDLILLWFFLRIIKVIKIIGASLHLLHVLLRCKLLTLAIRILVHHLWIHFAHWWLYIVHWWLYIVHWWLNMAHRSLYNIHWVLLNLLKSRRIVHILISSHSLTCRLLKLFLWRLLCFHFILNIQIKNLVLLQILLN